MPVSMDDVARQAGVSRGTVSHVLSNNQKAGIALATQERVRQIAAEMGYRPNRIARSLGRRRTDTLGLLLSGLQNPFFVHLLECAERMAMEQNYHVLMDALPTHPNTFSVAKLNDWPMDGALMWAYPGQTLQEFLAAQSANLPVVYLSGQPRHDDCDSVYFDLYSGVRMAMGHLIERGHRRIAYVFPFTWVLDQLDEPRLQGYREMCAQAGLPLQLILMERHESSRQAGFEAGISLATMPVETRPQAVLCFNDVVAQGVLFGLRRAGLHVPEDMAIVGVDGIDEGQYLDVPLTTVLLPCEELCREALRILIARIKEGPQAKMSPQIVRVPTRLILGATA